MQRTAKLRLPRDLNATGILGADFIHTVQYDGGPKLDHAETITDPVSYLQRTDGNTGKNA